MSDNDSDDSERLERPSPPYDRFGFQNSFKSRDSVHWSRPWTQPLQDTRKGSKERR
jgi:hypothetical protein